MNYILKHVLFALFTCGLAGYFFFKASSMPRSASLFPQIVAGLIFLLSAAMVFKAAHDVRGSGGEDAGAPAGKIHVARVVVFVALTAAYIFLIPRIGYFVVTPLFMLVMYTFLRALGIFKALVISVGFSVFIYFLFIWFLKLPIPMGLLEALFER